MMKTKWLVFVTFFLAVNSAAITQKSPDIPVRVVYERSPIEYHPASRNLQAKSEISAEEDEPTKTKEEQQQKRLHFGNRNLEEKVQLSPDELALSDQPQQQTNFNNAAELISQFPEQNIDDIYDKIQEIVLNGAKKIETQVSQIESTEDEKTPTKQEFLSKVNSTLESFLEDTKAVLSLKTKSSGLKQQGTTPATGSEGGNIFQTIFTNFQSASSNFFSQFNSPSSGTQNDEQPQQPSNPFLGPVQFIFNQISNGINGIQQGGSTPAAAQGDEQPVTPASGPVAFLQNAAQQIQQNVNNFFQPSTAAPGAQGDETSTQGGPIAFIQNAIQQIQQNIPNPFQPQTQAPPAQGTQSDTAPNTQNPQNPVGFIQNAGQQLVQAINNANPFQSTTQSSTGQSDENPQAPGGIQGIVSTIQNANPLNQGSNPITQAINNINPNQGGGNNPFQAGQQAISQLINPPASSATQSDAPAPSRPLQNALQNLNPFRRRTTVKPSQNQVDAKPTEVEAKPTEVEAKPTKVEAKPTKVEEKPIQVEATDAPSKPQEDPKPTTEVLSEAPISNEVIKEKEVAPSQPEKTTE